MALSAERGDELQGGGGGGGGREECARARRECAREWKTGRESREERERGGRQCIETTKKGGKEEERERSASAADRHRLTAEPDAQVSLQIFSSSVQQKILCVRIFSL